MNGAAGGLVLKCVEVAGGPGEIVGQVVFGEV